MKTATKVAKKAVKKVAAKKTAAKKTARKVASKKLKVTASDMDAGFARASIAASDFGNVGLKNPLLKAMEQTSSVSLTENGAKTFSTTLNSVLDLFAMGGALRTRANTEIENLFIKAKSEDALLALKCLFHIRNVRGGLGERRTFRIILKYLANNDAALVRKNLGNIVHFGRFDDLYELFGTKCEKDAMNFMAAQLDDDWKKMAQKDRVSLAAKWTKSLNASSSETKRLAKKFCDFLGKGEKSYRKSLSALRAYSNVLEVALSANDWEKIDYSKLPSKAGLIYRSAFKKHDPTGYQAFLEAVKKGEKKINSTTLFPYEIFEKLRGGVGNDTLDALWNALPDYIEDKSKNILVMADASGSMTGRPMDVAFSLAVYTAERNQGPFGGYFITYSESPTLQKIQGSTLTEKHRSLAKTCAYSTNLQAAFKMVLDHAIKIRAKAEDLPQQILVITDVEFNSTQNHGTNLDAIKTQYRNAGYEMPQLVFWNVNSRQNNVPAQANEKGVLLVSGCSPSVFKTLLSGKQYTPIDQMLVTLNSEEYARVTI